MCMRDNEKTELKYESIVFKSHLVFFLDGSSGLQESFHDLHVSFERGLVQSCSLELDMILKVSFLINQVQLMN